MSFEDFLGKLFKEGYADCTLRISQVAVLHEALLYALNDKVARRLTTHEISTYIQRGLIVKCPNCGQFSANAISTMILTQEMGGGNVIFGGPNSASLARGLCPGCGNANVTASFDMTEINARLR